MAAANPLTTTRGAPVFPLSSAELSSWAKFASEGGIGAALAVRDEEAEDATRDLMFLEGDEIVVLQKLAGNPERYLGSCEEIIGCFTAEAVRFITEISSPPSAAPTALPPSEPTSPNPHSSTAEPYEIESQPRPRRLASLKTTEDSMSELAARTRRRRMNVSGLGIEEGGPRSPKMLWAEESQHSPAGLPGAFVSFPSSPSCSSLTAPSLLTSPSSEFDESSTGHDATTPPPPTWTPSVAVEEDSTNHSLYSAKSSDEPTDSYHIIHTFPFPASRLPPPAPFAVPLAATAPSASPSLRQIHPPTTAAATSTRLRSQFSGASLATTASHLKISDGPSVDEMPHLPSAFSSPSSHSRAPKFSDASWRSDASDGSASGPATPGAEDLTLAMIFDSYRYSSASMATVDTTRGPDRGSKIGGSSDAETERDEEEETEELLELSSPGRGGSEGRGQQMDRQPFRFGAASTLRMQAMTSGRGERQGLDELDELPRPPRFSTDSFDVGTIPRLSSIFPRSSTTDSLASLSTLSSSSTSGSIPIENPTTELDAARRLFDAHFTSPRVLPSPPSSALPDSPTRTRSAGARRKSVKGLAISSPVSAVSATTGPAWRATPSNSPVGVLSDDVSGVDHSPTTPSSTTSSRSSPSSTSHPRVTVHGASPAPPSRRLDYHDGSAGQLRGHWRPKLTIASSEGEPGHYALHPSTSSPSSQHLRSATNSSAPPSPAFSFNSVSSASSPSASLFTEEWRMSRDHAAAAAAAAVMPTPSSPREQAQVHSTAKLRKPNLRLKTQPAVHQQQISSPIELDVAHSLTSPSLSSASTRDVFLASPRPPPTPSQPSYSPQLPSTPSHPPTSPRQLKHKTSRGLFTRKLSGRGEAVTPASPALVALPASKGISSKDFEDETVKVGGGEFDIVKPLMSTLGRSPLASSGQSFDDFGSSEGGHGDDMRSPSGSYSSHGLDASSSSFGLDEQSVENHRAKELAWVKALGSQSVAAMRRSKKMRALVHAGIPSSLRGRVWCLLAGTEDVKVEGRYKDLCDSERLPLDDQIELDIERTLHHHPHFIPVAQELESVVKAFARHEKQLGYSPSTGSLAGLILTQVADGETAFWTLVSLVKNYNLGQFFPAGRDELRVSTLAFGLILERTEPKLAKRLLELGVDPSSFFKRWLSTLFVDTLPWTTALPIVDLLLFDPSAYQLRTALAILELSHLDEPLNFPTRESVLHWLHNLPPPSFSPNLLLPTLHTIRLKESVVKKCFKRAEQIIGGGSK